MPDKEFADENVTDDFDANEWDDDALNGSPESAGEDEVAADATPVCPHCIEPLDPRAKFCAKCGGPVSGLAFSDPLGSVYAAGYGYRQATGGQPTRLVVMGIWLIFGPNALWILYLIRSGVTELISRVANLPDGRLPTTAFEQSTGELLLLTGLMIGVFAVMAAILWRVTWRYLSPNS